MNLSDLNIELLEKMIMIRWKRILYFLFVLPQLFFTKIYTVIIISIDIKVFVVDYESQSDLKYSK